MEENKLTAWERMELIRHKGRPTVRDYIPIESLTSFMRCTATGCSETMRRSSAASPGYMVSR